MQDPRGADADDILIRVRDLRFRYPGATSDALAGITLDVRRGEFVGVTGASGAGKSTLSLCLKGLVPAGQFNGTISVAGQSVGPGAPYFKDSALVFQNPETQIIGLTVAEDLAFGPENLRREPEWIRAAIPRYVDQVRLGGYEDADNLSSVRRPETAIGHCRRADPRARDLDPGRANLRAGPHREG